MCLLWHSSPCVWVLAEDFVVMCLYDGSYIFCTAVRDFDTVSVDDFSESMLGWEVLINECKEAFANVCFHCSVVRGVEPYDLPFLFAFSLFVCTPFPCVCEFVLVPTLIKCLLVCWCCVLKCLSVAGNVIEPCVD